MHDQDQRPTEARQNKIESLESRQMLAFAADVNFQPWYSRRDPNVITDIGFPTSRNGSLGYGWNHWKANEMVQRPPSVANNLTPNSYVMFDGSANEDDVWEMSVPNGTYQVSLTAGDPTGADGYYAIDVEGVSALRGAPTWNDRYVNATATVTVNDGRLTLTAGSGAYRNKLNSIHIEQLVTQTPATPTNLAAWFSGNSTVDLSWTPGDTNVDSYVIQQSDNGTDWRTVFETGGPTSRQTIWAIDSTTSHNFRIFAVNEDGWSRSSNTVRVAAITPTPPPDPAPDPTSYFDGVTVNPEYDPYAVAAALRTLGVNAVRIWGDVEWNKLVNRNFMDAARAYHNLGFHVTLLITDDKVPSYDTARAYFSFAVNQPGMMQSVDRWEIVNEPNFSSYWTGTYTQYVQNVLKPAYEVLHANGELVVGAAAGVFTDVAQSLKDAGYLNYVDFANYHPYGIDANEQIARIGEVKRIFAGKPLTLTEWNLMPYTATYEKWTAELNKVRTYVTRNVDSAFYYHLTFTADWASSAALFRTDAGGYTPNGIFFDMYDNWNIRAAA